MKISLFSKVLCIGQIVASVLIGSVFACCLVTMKKESFEDGAGFVMLIIGFILCCLWLWMGIVWDAKDLIIEFYAHEGGEKK